MLANATEAAAEEERFSIRSSSEHGVVAEPILKDIFTGYA